MMKKMTLLALLLAIAVAASVIGRADAALTLTIDDGLGNSLSLADNGVAVTAGTVSGTGDNFGAIDGVLQFTGTVGAYDVVTQTAVSSSPSPFLNLVYSVRTLGPASGTLSIQLTDTDFVSGIGNFTFRSDVNNSSQGGTFTAMQMLDADNVAFGGVPEFTADHGAVLVNQSEAIVLGVALTGPFSLTEAITITHTGPGTTSGDITSTVSTVVPTPAALPAGLALMGLVAVHRRRRKA